MRTNDDTKQDSTPKSRPVSAVQQSRSKLTPRSKTGQSPSTPLAYLYADTHHRPEDPGWYNPFEPGTDKWATAEENRRAVLSSSGKSHDPSRIDRSKLAWAQSGVQLENSEIESLLSAALNRRNQSPVVAGPASSPVSSSPLRSATAGYDAATEHLRKENNKLKKRVDVLEKKYVTTVQDYEKKLAVVAEERDKAIGLIRKFEEHYQRGKRDEAVFAATLSKLKQEQKEALELAERRQYTAERKVRALQAANNALEARLREAKQPPPPQQQASSSYEEVERYTRRSSRARDSSSSGGDRGYHSPARRTPSRSPSRHSSPSPSSESQRIQRDMYASPPSRAATQSPQDKSPESSKAPPSAHQRRPPSPGNNAVNRVRSEDDNGSGVDSSLDRTMDSSVYTYSDIGDTEAALDTLIGGGGGSTAAPARSTSVSPIRATTPPPAAVAEAEVQEEGNGKDGDTAPRQTSTAGHGVTGGGGRGGKKKKKSRRRK